VLVIYSFGRVVERHEREAMMQNPSSWDPLYKVEQATRDGVVPRALSSISVASNPRRPLRVVPNDDPYTAIPASALRSGHTYEVVPRERDEGRLPPEDNPFEDFEYVGGAGLTVLPDADERIRRQNAAGSIVGADGSREMSDYLSPGERAIPPFVPTSPSLRRVSPRNTLSQLNDKEMASRFPVIVVSEDIQDNPRVSRISEQSRYSYFHYEEGR